MVLVRDLGDVLFSLRCLESLETTRCLEGLDLCSLGFRQGQHFESGLVTRIDRDLDRLCREVQLTGVNNKRLRCLQLQKDDKSSLLC